MNRQVIRKRPGAHNKIEYIMILCLLICVLAMGQNNTAYAADTLRFACSAQTYKALEMERLLYFENQYGVEVKLNVCSSNDALAYLENSQSDLASTVIRMPKQLREKGFFETLYCKDPLVIMAHPVCNVGTISKEQIKGIFSGVITNWKDLGGPDQKIIVIIPGEKTGAYDNFKQLVMNGKDIVFDLKSQVSTRVIEACRRFPWSISFTTCGAVDWNKLGLKEIKINGFSPYQNGYPYHQDYSFVFQGKPKGAVKTFIDFAFSKKGTQFILKKEMLPYPVSE